MSKNITCANCGAENPPDYAFCHCCRVEPGHVAAEPSSAEPAKAKAKHATKKRATKKNAKK